MAHQLDQTRQLEAGRNVANQHDDGPDHRDGQRFAHESDSWADKYRSRFASGARSRFSTTGGSIAARNDDQLGRGWSLRGRGAEDFERWDDRLKEMHKQLRIARSRGGDDGDDGRRTFQAGRQGNGGTRPGKR